MQRENKILRGKVCLVSGATGGLGQAAALGLARMGASIIIIGRNPEKIEATLSLLREETGNNRSAGFQADLSSQAQVRRVADEINARYPSIDVLVNNVGATLMQYQTSADGIEMTWAVNYLSHILLTDCLMERLKLAASTHGEARIVELTSSIYRFSSTNFDNRQKSLLYNGVLAYAQSKRAINAYVVEKARRLNDCGITINAVTPGFVRTGITSGNSWLIQLAMRVVRRFSLSVERGVEPILYLASAPELCGVSGKYFYQSREMPDDPSTQNPAVIARLWRITERMTGLSLY